MNELLTKSNIKAVIFDSDGTLVDTRNLIVDGYKANLIKHGYSEFARSSLIQSAIGGRVSHTISRLIGEPENSNIVIKMTVAQDDIQDILAPTSVKPYENVKQSLAALRSMGLKTAVFTSGSAYQLRRNLSIVGIHLEDSFDAFITADDGYHSKPNPAGLLACVKNLGLLPDECAYVGDHEVDILCAHNAGLALSIGVSHGFNKKGELQKKSDLVIDNFSELIC